MLNVSGIAKVTNLKKVIDKMVVGDLYTVSTNQKGETVSSFYKAKFVGKSLDYIKAERVGNKTTLEIQKAILSQEKRTTKEGKLFNELVVTVFEMSKKLPKVENFKTVNDIDLPF